MRPLPVVPVVAGLLALALPPLGCSAPKGPSFEPMALLALHPVAYRGEVLSEPRSLETPAFRKAAFEPGAEVVEIDVDVVRFDEVYARELVASGDGAVGAWTVRRDDAARFLGDARRAGARVTSSDLALAFGTRGWLAVIGQRSFVRSYRIRPTADAVFADPVVDVLADGLVLEATADLADDVAGEPAFTLDLVARLSGVESPIRTVETRVPGCAVPVSIHQPLVSEQGLATKVTLAASQALVLSAPAPDGGARLFLIVRLGRNPPARG